MLTSGCVLGIAHLSVLTIVIILCVTCAIVAVHKATQDRYMDALLTRAEAGLPAVKWPRSFLWGVCTAAFQVEAPNYLSTWSLWAHTTTHVKEPPLLNCDTYNNFEAVDVAHAKWLGVNSFRFSIDWARIEPNRGVFKQAAVDRYVSMARALREADIEPVLTLVHFALPLWTSGWEDYETIEADFARFCEFVIPQLTPHVRYFVTINEPVIDAINTHLIGTRWPGKQSVRSAALAMKGMWRCHNVAFKSIKASRADTMVSVAKNVTVKRPRCGWSPVDHLLSSQFDVIYNHLWLDACRTGRFSIMGVTDEGAAGTLDFIGVNHYNHCRVGLVKWKPDVDMVSDGAGVVNDIGWEMRGASMFHVLKALWQRHGLPLMITENGTADATDAHRPGILTKHVYCVANAMRIGIPILGYHHWTLHDNYEWDSGYSTRFGLFHTDFQAVQKSVVDGTDPRACFRPRTSAFLYQKIIRDAREISSDVIYLTHGLDKLDTHPQAEDG